MLPGSIKRKITTGKKVMNKLHLFILLIITGCSNSSENDKLPTVNKDQATDTRQADSTATAGIIADFFNFFDERNVSKIDSLLLPETKIIHHNGAVTNTAELVQIIKETKNWWPRTRRLTDFEFTEDKDLVVAGVLNKVTFSLPGNKRVVEPYRETWVFKKVQGSWKTIRIHYSKITVDKHSEEVN